MAHPSRVGSKAHSRPVEPWLQSALDVVLRVAAARGCAVIWRDPTGETHMAATGSCDGLDPRLTTDVIDVSDAPLDGLDGAWTTPLVDAAGERFGVLAVDDPEPA